MVVNIPIRLVRKDSSLIPLNVTTLTLDVDRSINPHSLPIAGNKRFAFDMNMAKAVILLEGVIIDDALTTQNTDLGQKGIATVDFSSLNVLDSNGNITIDTLIGSGNNWDYFGITLTTDSFSYKDTPTMNLRSESGTNIQIYFIKSDNTFDYNLGDNGYFHVSICEANGTMRSAANVALYLTNLINSSLHSNYLSSRFIANRRESRSTGNSNEMVEIKQTTSGNTSNSVSPSWEGYNDMEPLTKQFTGGESSSSAFTSMSAGDKVMSLYGTLNNSNDGGLASIGRQKVDDDGYTPVDLRYGDYIIGIQIPFNSTVDNSSGDKYIAKNFFMPTGAPENVITKHPRNAQLASSTIDDTNDNSERTFIKGAVTKATFVQVGGEPIYQFNIQFVPVDYLI